MTDDAIRGWDVPEIREAVFRRSKQRADLVRADAMERARRIANLLKVRYSASAVTLFGSLAETCFHDKSDIDILVEGFRGQYWEMYVMADEIAGPFDLSIVCIEDAQDTLIEHAREGGDLPLRPENYLVVQARIAKERENLDRLLNQMSRHGIYPEVHAESMGGFRLCDNEALRIIGSMLHDFYTFVESIAKTVAARVD